MNKFALISALLLCLAFCSSGFSQGASITNARSFHKTSAGAIGPSGIIATTIFDLTIHSRETILLDSALISGFKVLGGGMIIPTNKEGRIPFGIQISTHQKNTVWYTAAIEFQGISVGTEVYKAPNSGQMPDLPAIILYLRTRNSSHTIIKHGFDQERTQFNK